MAEVEVDELQDSRTEKFKEMNISLIISDYNDIFSSFDPRSYLERALSDDFLQECKRAARDKKDTIELRILVPKSKRNVKEEWKIKKRLKEHFEHHLKLEDKEIRTIRGEGGLWFVFGTIFILAATWISSKPNLTFPLKIIETMLEPAGWFSFWEGLGKVFIVAKEKSPEYEFYKKMAKAEINFAEY